MGLSQPRQIFGVHTFAAYNRSTRKSYGAPVRVLKNSTFSFTGELVQSTGGASKFPWAIEESSATSEISLSMEEFPTWAFEIFAGKAPTVDTTGSATGAVSTLTNRNGSSVVVSTTGIASVGITTGDEADLKFTKYVVVATDVDEVDVYAMSDIDFDRGVDKSFINDTCKITATPLTLTGGGLAVAVPGFGIELTPGSGTLAMVSGHTASFEVVPPYSEKLEVTIGGASDTFPEFGAIMVAQRRGNGELLEVDAFRCKGIGLPIGLEEKTFAAPEVTAQAFYDATRSGVASIRWVKPS